VGEKHVRGLGGIDHGPAADGEEAVRARILRPFAAARRRLGVGVLRHLVEDSRDLDPAVGKPLRDPVDEPGAADHLVGDHERPPRPLLGELEPGALDQVTACDHPGRSGELVEGLEARHLTLNHSGRVLRSRSLARITPDQPVASQSGLRPSARRPYISPVILLARSRVRRGRESAGT
jgi:hypothetical protein